MKSIQTIGAVVKVCCRWAVSDFTNIRNCVDRISSHSSFVTRDPNCVAFLQSRLFVKCFTRLLQLPLEWLDWDQIRSVKFLWGKNEEVLVLINEFEWSNDLLVHLGNKLHFLSAYRHNSPSWDVDAMGDFQQ